MAVVLLNNKKTEDNKKVVNEVNNEVVEETEISEEQVKIALANYYDLKSASNCDYLLNMLTEKGSLNYDESKNQYLDNGEIITSLLKSEYKEAMLKYVSEDEYLKNWDMWFTENENGNLVKVEGGGSQPIYTIDKVSIVENGHYLATISYIIDASADEEIFTETIEVHVSLYNGNCVIDSIEKIQ